MEPLHQSDDDGREAAATGYVQVTGQNPPVQNTIPPVTQPDPAWTKLKEEAQLELPLQPNPDTPYNATTGWTAMAHNVREVDEQKVRGHKEDIDTILVFAGLFSAVMTAFLVESYHNLSPDPTQVMIMLMRQVASQTHSYSLNNGFLNSTASPLPPTLSDSDFHPTANAVRVNVLWFASLTLSLVSASFSILVKQWLREYLAGDYTSPQARLRIRHFRYPGLEHWKVFEIAATIPLLLQLSLALFLVGLCFFTADVHDTVGHTTLPLVAGWAVLFIAVSFAPIFSPRCPYKTTVLITLLTAIRKRIYRTFLWAKGLQSPTNATIDLFAGVSGKWSFMNLAYDEEAVTKEANHDIDILISVDSIQTDDHHLPVMWEAVQQTMPNPTQSIRFVQNVIGHRIQRDVSDTAVFSADYLDLTRLPKPTVTFIWLKINSLLKEEIMRQLGNSPQSESNIDWLPWMKDCIHILLSRTSTPLPHAVDDTLSLLMNRKFRCATLFEVIVSRISNPDTLPYVLERFRGVLSRQRELLLDTLKIIVEAYFCADHGTHNVPSCWFPSSLEDHPKVTPTHLQTLVSIVVSASLEQFDFRPDAFFLRWQDARLVFILGLPNHHLYHDDTMQFVKFLLLRASANIYCKHASGLYWRPSYRSHAQELFIEAIVSSELHESEEIIKRVIRSLDWHWNQWKESEDHSSRREYRLDPLETYYMVLRALEKATEEKGKASLEPLWMLVRVYLWRGVKKGMEIVAARLGQHEGHPEIARSCLELIDTFDIPSTPDYEDDNAFLAWADNFDEDESLVPDACIRMLGRFLPRADDVKSYRLRRTRRMDARIDAETHETESYEDSDADSDSHDEDSSTESSGSISDLGLRLLYSTSVPASNVSLSHPNCSATALPHSESPAYDDVRSEPTTSPLLHDDQRDPIVPANVNYYKVDKFHRVAQP